MGDTIRIPAADGHELDAYIAKPAAAPRGSVIILQEFFGVNAHMRRVADDYAREGYVALAPALFDRLERGVDLPYDTGGMKRGRELRAALKPEQTLVDVQAGIDAAAAITPEVAALGYCWGGVLAYARSLEPHNLTCAVGYYGATIPDYIDRPTRVPILLHFAGYDEYMQPDDPERIAAAHPEIELYRYPGTEHGFNCDDRQYYDAEAAALARTRTLDFLERTFAAAAEARA